MEVQNLITIFKKEIPESIDYLISLNCTDYLENSHSLFFYLEDFLGETEGDTSSPKMEFIEKIKDIASIKKSKSLLTIEDWDVKILIIL